jgi:hypothetical protein
MLNQQDFIDSIGRQVTLLPRNGCPGPVVKPLGENALLVIIDTQWLLHKWQKPGEESSCDAKTPEQFYDQIQKIFAQNKNKRIILAAHHPLITYGEHGGVFRLRAHIFPLTELTKGLYIPLPIIGSIYPLYRKYIGHVQDTSHPTYKKMSEQIQKIMDESPGSIYVSGHEHALQYIVKGESHFVVSGSGSKIEFVKKKGYAKYASHERGFVKIALGADGGVSIIYVHVDKDYPNGREVYRAKL